MLHTHETVAVALLATTIRIQKSDRPKDSIVQGNVAKYGRRGFRVADDGVLKDVFERLYTAPESVTPEKDGALCLVIMSRGLQDQRRLGWSTEEIETFAVRDYAPQLPSPLSDGDLRSFVRFVFETN